MKNKKLFAILTLVCFMFTLMPVAAFAADPTYVSVDENSANITTGSAVTLNVTKNGAETAYYIFAEKNGAPYIAWDVQEKGLNADGKTITTPVINDAGEYTIYAVDKNAYTQKAFEKKADNGLPATIATLKANTRIAMLEQTVVVNGASNKYTVAFYDANMNAIANNTLTNVSANAGYSDVTVYVKVTNNGSAVVGKAVDISTNSNGVTIAQAKDVTGADGTIKLKISASIAGEFKVYAEFGNEEAILTVKPQALPAATVVTVGEPTAPIALDSDVNKSEVFFSFTDANNNATAPEVGADTKIVVVEKPAGSTITDAKMMAANLVPTENGYTFGPNAAAFDKEGTYTFKVILSNGNFATATVTVKEFQKPVELQLVYPTNAVELDGKIAPKAVRFVDVNGTVKACTIGSDVVLSARGYAIESFDANGTVTVKSSEGYVGEKITVLAVSERYNLTDSVELVVAKEAAGVKYVNTNADVAVNNTLVANIVDEDGNKVALNSSVKKANVTVQYVVVEKPANAKVAVTTKNNDLSKLASQGEFKVSFTASEVGTYKLQTVVRYEQEAQAGAQAVVKYYSGIEEITVGNTGFEDIVVMSVGSNEIVVNAATKAIDAAPIIENNRTFVPFRALAEAFGATVAFDEATQTVTAELDGVTVVMTIGAAEYTVNGVAKTADVAPFINGSRTMVPVRFVAEAFGIKVTPTYDENGATADILFAK